MASGRASALRVLRQTPWADAQTARHHIHAMPDFGISLPVLIALLAGTFLVALLYSSVGHAGATGYIATMSLAGLAMEVVRPAALVLNIGVASVAAWHFWRAGHFSWRLFWPFAVLSVPAAFLGGGLKLPASVWQMMIGGVLLFSAVRFLAVPGSDEVRKTPSIWTSLLIGAGLGFLAGLTSTGGGVFLTPVLLWMKWAGAKPAAAVSAAFILVNSPAGLIGQLAGGATIPLLVIPLGVAALLGGWFGSRSGSQWLSAVTIRRLLAVVLLIAGGKMIVAAMG